MDKLIVGGCASLVLFGYCIGSIQSLEATGLGRLKYALELGSFVATITACVAAVLSLRLWRRQFRHGKEFEILTKANTAINELNVARRFITSYMHAQVARKFERENAGYHREQSEMLSEQWESAHFLMRELIGEMSLFVPTNKHEKMARHCEKIYEITTLSTMYTVDQMCEETNPDVPGLARQTIKDSLAISHEMNAMRRELREMRIANIGGS